MIADLGQQLSGQKASDARAAMVVRGRLHAGRLVDPIGPDDYRAWERWRAPRQHRGLALRELNRCDAAMADFKRACDLELKEACEHGCGPQPTVAETGSESKEKSAGTPPASADKGEKDENANSAPEAKDDLEDTSDSDLDE